MYAVKLRRTTLAVENRQTDVVDYDATADMAQAEEIRFQMIYNRVIEGGTYHEAADIVIDEDEQVVYHAAIEPA
jgi:hypothetical protein